MRLALALLLLVGCVKSDKLAAEMPREFVEAWRARRVYKLLEFRNMNEFDRLQITPISSGMVAEPLLFTDDDWSRCQSVEVWVNFLPLGVAVGRGERVLLVGTSELSEDLSTIPSITVDDHVGETSRNYVYLDEGVALGRGVMMIPPPNHFAIFTDSSYFWHRMECKR